jgi:hypothetical protein
MRPRSRARARAGRRSGINASNRKLWLDARLQRQQARREELLPVADAVGLGRLHAPERALGRPPVPIDRHAQAPLQEQLLDSKPLGAHDPVRFQPRRCPPRVSMNPLANDPI